MKQSIRSLIAAVALLIGFVSSVNAALIVDVDTFQGPSTTVLAGPNSTTGPVTESGLGGVTLAGVDRLVTVQNTANNIGSIAGVSNYLGGHQFLGSNASDAGGFVTIDYKFPVAQSLANLGTNPNAGIQIHNVSNTGSQAVLLDITLTDASNVTRTAVLAVPNIPTNTPVDVFYGYASLFGSVDVSNIKEIVVVIDTHNIFGNDVRLGAIQSVTDPSSGALIVPAPEPASLALWSIVGLSGMGCRWYRRRKTVA